METKYILLPSCNNGGTNLITDAVIRYAKDKYTDVVAKESSLQSVIDDLQSYAESLKKAKPRAKIPTIKLSLETQRDTIGWLWIDEWTILLHQVRGEI